MTVKVVLIEPSHPGNIGAVARAMGNMGVCELVLVRPVEYLVEEARVRSASNEVILFEAVECATLDEATSDCSLVIGTSARVRSIEWPNLSPRLAMCEAASASVRGERIAILFGPERAGLSNLALDRCHVMVRIPVDERAPSINLAGAVLVILYELRLALDIESGIISEPVPSESSDGADRKATGTEVQSFFDHLQSVLEDVEFISNGPREHLMRKIRRIFLRPGLTEDDVNILRGILTAVTKSTARANERAK